MLGVEREAAVLRGHARRVRVWVLAQAAMGRLGARRVVVVMGMPAAMGIQDVVGVGRVGRVGRGEAVVMGDVVGVEGEISPLSAIHGWLMKRVERLMIFKCTSSGGWTANDSDC